MADIRFAQALAQGSRAPSTLARYEGHWRRWQAWCDSRGIPSVPAQPQHVAAYLGGLLRWCVTHSKSFAPIKMASACIHTAHELAGLDGTVTAHPMVSSVRSAAERILGRAPRNTKQPLPMQLCVNAAVLCETQGDLLVAAFMLVCFAGFLRYSDAVRVPAFGVKFVPAGAELWIPSRKNDQFKYGTVVTICKAAHSAAACPVLMLQKYLSHCPPPSGDAALFRKPGAHSPWPYHSARDSILSAIASSVDMPASMIQKVFGTHSLRKGGATAAANKLPGDSRTVALFLAHGGWRSKQAASVYVKPPTTVARAAGM